MFPYKNDEVSVMYLSYRPSPPLDEFVDHFWLIDGGQVPQLEKIMPSGTIELVVNLKDDKIYIHDPDEPRLYKQFAGVVFSGTYSRPFICNALQHESIMGVHFKPGGAFPFLGIEPSELTNAHANLGDLWGQYGQELRERLCVAGTPKQRFAIMERTLINRLHFDTDATHQLQVRDAVRMLATGGKRSLVRNVSRELGFSQRRFIQLFRSHVGLTPKVFSRIQRFQQARALAERLETPNWTELALNCGYFDQAHLIGDFKEFSGSTPRVYPVREYHKDPRLKENHVPFR